MASRHLGSATSKFFRDLAVIGVGAALLAIADGTAGLDIPEPYRSALPAVALFVYRDLRNRGIIPGVEPKDD